MSLFNSIMGLPDTLMYGRAIAKHPLPKEAVIILGHPRTGTTHLHNLLALDDRVAFASTFQVGFPGAFISMESVLKPLLQPVLTAKRPMDNMNLSWDLPMEDEVAVNVLSGGISPYSMLVMMTRWRDFLGYFTYEQASASDQAAWLEAFKGFVRKVSYAAGGEKPILIKSPVHTARIPLMKSLFPKAKFIYLHRHPYEVFQSSAHMADTSYWYNYLATPKNDDILEYVLEHHNILLDNYLRDRALLGPSDLMEIPFAKLDAAPMETLRQIYTHLGWTIAAELQSKFTDYFNQLEDFKKNDHALLSDEQKAEIRERWAKAFTAFDYKP